MKKFLSLLLTFVMLFSMTMPAMAAENTQTIYFENTENWEVVNAFYWIEGSGENLNNWPGTALTHIEDSIWSIAVPTSADNIIFNNGSGTQTMLPLEPFANVTEGTSGNQTPQAAAPAGQ